MTTNLIADRMRYAMRIDMPEQHKALQAGVQEIELLWKFCRVAYRWIGHPAARAMALPEAVKAWAYDELSAALYEHVPAPADTDRTIADIRASDAQSAATWFTGKPSATALAIRDRRWLLAEVQRLEVELAELRQSIADAAARRQERERLAELRKRTETATGKDLDAIGEELGAGRCILTLEPDSEYRSRILNVLRRYDEAAKEPG